MGFYPNNSQKLFIEEAINSIDSVVNFSDYDGNGDGVVDGFFVVYAGQRPDTKNPNRIYPHQWNITPIIKDGKTISSYTIVPEYRSEMSDTTIGVFCHEFRYIFLQSSVTFYNGKCTGFRVKNTKLVENSLIYAMGGVFYPALPKILTLLDK